MFQSPPTRFGMRPVGPDCITLSRRKREIDLPAGPGLLVEKMQAGADGSVQVLFALGKKKEEICRVDC